MEELVMRTEIPAVPKKEGKARDIYDFGDRLAIITTDRISAFDVVMPNGIPGKGMTLNKMTEFWFHFVWRSLHIFHHMISTNIRDFPEEMKNRHDLVGRTMIVRKLKIIPIECVVRGYISGSLWKAYQKSHSDADKDALDKVCVLGFDFPLGLMESEKLPEPIFTPSTKAVTGHDENIDFERMVNILATWLPENGYPFLEARVIANGLKKHSLEIYTAASEYAWNRGIIIADTKLEFGLSEGGIIVVADEIFTPDSSRFWDKNKYQPGRSQESFDKQFLRDWLKNESGWDMKSEPPELPTHVVEMTKEKYQQALEMLVS